MNFTPLKSHPTFCRLSVSVFSFILSIIAGVFSTAAVAATPSDFAQSFEYHDVEISPDGKHLALVIKDQGKRKLAVVTADDFSSVGGADFGSRQEVGQYFWANNERLVIAINYFLPWEDSPISTGELYAIDYNGKRGEIIYGQRAGEQTVGTNLQTKKSVDGVAEVINRLDHDDNDILIASYPFSRDGSRVPAVHRLNIDNGRMSSMLAGGPVPFTKFITDKKGNIRLAVGINSDDEKRAFRFVEDGMKWIEIPRDQFGRGYNPLTIDESGEFLYFIDNKDQDTKGLYKQHIETGKKETLFLNEQVDITSLVFSYDDTEIYAVRTDAGYPLYTVFDKSSEEARVYEFLINTFKGYQVDITSSSDDGNLWSIYVSNDQQAGSFYLYDKSENKFRLLFSNFPSIPKEQFSESIPFTFKASDGIEIPGYITYPTSVDPNKNVPLITLVHGGPFARDYWSFDREVQMLTAQGYAVLRLNFRGSSGYGLAYGDASEQNWGTRVQQDIIEGTEWVIQQGGIQQDKVCIMGASFGAYSAVMSATIKPDLFKCVIANAGVYDLEMMFNEGDIPRILYGKAFLENELGTDLSVLRAQSPVNHVSKLKAPLLLAHGEEDERAPFKHAEALMAQLDKHNKPYQTFFRGTAGHGFFDDKSRSEYFEEVAGFLQKQFN